ncbi:MAG: hypothetical protein HND48_11155 [Chloroflexi bacterium]|nr:hypothetical protein [Chloroflexota bacterium]
MSLRAAKIHTSNITAIVTVADDGGSSGRLRREMRVAPPGDLRNNIAALADDESLMTRLLQYRFSGGELAGTCLRQPVYRGAGGHHRQPRSGADRGGARAQPARTGAANDAR